MLTSSVKIILLAVEFIIVDVVGMRTLIERFTKPTYNIIVHSWDTQLVVRNHFVALRRLCVLSRMCVQVCYAPTEW
jgi:hypothetical protein